MSKKLKVFVLTNNQKAITHLRMADCMYDLYDRGYIEKPMCADKQPIEVEREFMKTADILYFQGYLNSTFLNMLATVRDLNPKIKLVLDLDDNNFELDITNPVYPTFCVEEMLMVSGKMIPNPLLADNLATMGILDTLIMEADALVTTNEILASTLFEKNPNIFIRTNYLVRSIWDFPHIPIRDDGKIKIQWQGGNTHIHDWIEYNDAIVKVVKENKNTVLEMITTPGQYEQFLDRYPKDRVRFFEFLDYDAHSFRLNCLKPDIAVIPLKETPFNVCKSDLKFTEYALLGIPCVASNISPYKDSVQHGVTGFLAKDDEEMHLYLTKLVKDKDLRIKMGAAAREWALENRTYDTQYEEWFNTLVEITKLPAWHQVKE